jgi:serine/threonine protein kinase
LPLLPGHTLTFYEILGPLGAGAMGEVYRARDTRLEREVAIKVLPEELAGDLDRLRRFEREAKTLASLNHPNVAQVFGIDQVGDTCFMAMELVPGEDLAARLAHGALAPDEALDICRQIAEGVEAAHEAGVIHRDLKPANVVIAPDGRVKVLDFGLAKPADSDDGASSTTDSVLTTEEGRLLGTPTYMAPEQARGRMIDKRIDVWAFGCVLYECLTGRRPFDGESMGDVLAAVLEREPDLSRLPAATPTRVANLVERCLRKDHRTRLRDLGEARIAFEELVASGGEPVASEPVTRPRSVAIGIAVALVAVSTGAYLVGRAGRPAKRTERYVSVPLTSSSSYRNEPAWSPDSGWLALGRMESGSQDLYLRHVVSGEEKVRRAGPGDESAFAWAPDDSYIAFVASDLPGTPVLIASPHRDSEERKVIETNMRVFDSASYGVALGNQPWSLDSRSLLVSRSGDDGSIAIWEIGLDGSEEQLTFPPAGHDDLAASYSFTGDRIVFVRRGTLASRLMVMPAGGGSPSVLLDDGTLTEDPAWLPGDDRVLYLAERGGARNLCVLDVASSSTEQLTSLVSMWASSPAVSSTGRIAYAATRHDTILTTLELESGATRALTTHTDSNWAPRFSPDGDSIAYSSDRTGDMEIWVRDLDGTEHRITRADGADVYPDWSPDGRRLVFVSSRTGSTEMWVADRDGGNSSVLVSQGGIEADAGGGGESTSPRWSPATPAGELIGFIVASDQGRALWGVPPDGSRPPRKLMDDVVAFDWYLDCRRVVCTLDRGRGEELVVVDLETDERETLWTGAHAEIDVAPDGSAVMLCKGLGHLNMGLATLELVPPAEPGGLPSARGEPTEIVRPEGRWHVHHGGWAPDSKSVVYIHDADTANIYELVEQR